MRGRRLGLLDYLTSEGVFAVLAKGLPDDFPGLLQLIFKPGFLLKTLNAEPNNSLHDSRPSISAELG